MTRVSFQYVLTSLADWAEFARIITQMHGPSIKTRITALSDEKVKQPARSETQ